jgi:hypothetical protein
MAVVQIQCFDFDLRGGDDMTKSCQKMKQRQRAHLDSM